MGIGAGLLLAKEGVDTFGRVKRTQAGISELEQRGVSVPFHQRFLTALIGGPLIGSRLQEQSIERKLARTGGPVGSPIPTRGVLGLDGDTAFADTARTFREQLARQTTGEISNINRQFAGAGRFTSGQRLSTIERAQEGARQEFGRFLGGTALERFLQQQRLQTQADIAQAQIEGQAGQGRTQLVGQGVGALASIFAQNPQFFIDLFTRSGTGPNSFSNTTTRLTDEQLF